MAAIKFSILFSFYNFSWTILAHPFSLSVLFILTHLVSGRPFGSNGGFLVRILNNKGCVVKITETPLRNKKKSWFLWQEQVKADQLLYYIHISKSVDDSRINETYPLNYPACPWKYPFHLPHNVFDTVQNISLSLSLCIYSQRYLKHRCFIQGELILYIFLNVKEKKNKA